MSLPCKNGFTMNLCATSSRAYHKAARAGFPKAKVPFWGVRVTIRIVGSRLGSPIDFWEATKSSGRDEVRSLLVRATRG